MMERAIFSTICGLLAIGVVVLWALLARQRRLTAELRFEQQQAAAAPPPPPEPPASSVDRARLVRSAQEAVNGTVRRMQALGNEAAERIQVMVRTYGADVLRDVMPVDHVVAQMQRRLQVLAVLCGSWPGQQRSAAELADVVRGAQSRIHDYNRVRIAAAEEKTAMVGRVVEPIGMALAELLDNATRSSPPTSPVDVVFDTEYHGVSIMVIDGGVGMAPEELRRCSQLLQHGQHQVDLTELGNPPRTGFAVCGVLAARYGFRVSLDAGSPRGGLRAILFLPSALLTTLEPEEPRAAEPTPAAVPAPVPVAVGAAPPESGAEQPELGALPKRRRRSWPEAATGAEEPREPARELAPALSTEAAANNLRAFQRGSHRAADSRDQA